MSSLKARVLNRVIDSLDLRVYRESESSYEFASLVDEMRGYIEDYEFGDEEFFLYINGVPFHLKPSGSFPYEFVLINEKICDIRVWNPDKWKGRACRQTGQLYVNFRSYFLQSKGIEGANNFLDDVLSFFFFNPHAINEDFEKISRMDLAIDVELNRELTFSDLDSFVYRAKKIEVNDAIINHDVDVAMNKMPSYEGKGKEFYEAMANYVKIYLKQAKEELAKIDSSDVKRVIINSKKIESVYFGRFGSKLYARIYNKPAESMAHAKLYMLDLYFSKDWDGKKPVYRIEFSISGEFLREFHVQAVKDSRDFKHIEQIINPLWKYLSSDWMTHREYTKRTGEEFDRPKTWGFSSFWQAVSELWDESEVMYIRDYSGRLICEDDHLYAVVRGYLVSIISRHYAGSRGELQQQVLERLTEILADPTLIDDVIRRAELHGLDDDSLSAGIRREVMVRGKGS